MSASERDPTEYILGSNWLESVRLNSQHTVSVKSHGWLLHPKVHDYVAQHSSEANFRVADLACGTGIMALELSELFPDMAITALDLSNKQFPTPWTVPDNVTFGEINLLKDVPQEYVGAFDVIGLRFVYQIIYREGRETMLANLKAMLKPGGWLQWTESRPPYFSEVDAQTEQLKDEPTAFSNASDFLSEHNTSTWLRDEAEKGIASHGFVDVEKIIPPWKKAIAQQMTHMVLFTQAEILKGLTRAVPADQAREIDAKWQETEERVKNGTQLGYHFLTILARKPSI